MPLRLDHSAQQRRGAAHPQDERLQKLVDVMNEAKGSGKRYLYAVHKSNGEISLRASRRISALNAGRRVALRFEAIDHILREFEHIEAARPVIKEIRRLLLNVPSDAEVTGLKSFGVRFGMVRGLVTGDSLRTLKTLHVKLEALQEVTRGDGAWQGFIEANDVALATLAGKMGAAGDPAMKDHLRTLRHYLQWKVPSGTAASLNGFSGQPSRVAHAFAEVDNVLRHHPEYLEGTKEGRQLALLRREAREFAHDHAAWAAPGFLLDDLSGPGSAGITKAMAETVTALAVTARDGNGASGDEKAKSLGKAVAVAIRAKGYACEAMFPSTHHCLRDDVARRLEQGLANTPLSVPAQSDQAGNAITPDERDAHVKAALAAFDAALKQELHLPDAVPSRTGATWRFEGQTYTYGGSVDADHAKAKSAVRIFEPAKGSGTGAHLEVETRRGIGPKRVVLLREEIAIHHALESKRCDAAVKLKAVVPGESPSLVFEGRHYGALEQWLGPLQAPPAAPAERAEGVPTRPSQRAMQVAPPVVPDQVAPPVVPDAASTTALLQHIALDVARSLRNLHGAGIAHLHLDTSNIAMLHPEQREQRQQPSAKHAARPADAFPVARLDHLHCATLHEKISVEEDEFHDKSVTGKAPERLLKKSGPSFSDFLPGAVKASDRFDTRAADVWSFGLLLAQMFHPKGDSLFKANDAQALRDEIAHYALQRQAILKGQVVAGSAFADIEKAHPGMASLIAWMLDPRPALRPTMEQVLNRLTKEGFGPLTAADNRKPRSRSPGSKTTAARAATKIDHASLDAFVMQRRRLSAGPMRPNPAHPGRSKRSTRASANDSNEERIFDAPRSDASSENSSSEGPAWRLDMGDGWEAIGSSETGESHADGNVVDSTGESSSDATDGANATNKQGRGPVPSSEVNRANAILQQAKSIPLSRRTTGKVSTSQFNTATNTAATDNAATDNAATDNAATDNAATGDPESATLPPINTEKFAAKILYQRNQWVEIDQLLDDIEQRRNEPPKSRPLGDPVSGSEPDDFDAALGFFLGNRGMQESVGTDNPSPPPPAAPAVQRAAPARPTRPASPVPPAGKSLVAWVGRALTGLDKKEEAKLTEKYAAWEAFSRVHPDFKPGLGNQFTPLSKQEKDALEFLRLFHEAWLIQPQFDQPDIHAMHQTIQRFRKLHPWFLDGALAPYHFAGMSNLLQGLWGNISEASTPSLGTGDAQKNASPVLEGSWAKGIRSHFEGPDLRRVFLLANRADFARLLKSALMTNFDEMEKNEFRITDTTHGLHPSARPEGGSEDYVFRKKIESGAKKAADALFAYLDASMPFSFTDSGLQRTDVVLGQPPVALNDDEPEPPAPRLWSPAPVSALPATSPSEQRYLDGGKLYRLREVDSGTLSRLASVAMRINEVEASFGSNPEGRRTGAVHLLHRRDGATAILEELPRYGALDAHAKHLLEDLTPADRLALVRYLAGQTAEALQRLHLKAGTAHGNLDLGKIGIFGGHAEPVLRLLDFSSATDEPVKAVAPAALHGMPENVNRIASTPLVIDTRADDIWAFGRLLYAIASPAANKVMADRTAYAAEREDRKKAGKLPTPLNNLLLNLLDIDDHDPEAEATALGKQAREFCEFLDHVLNPDPLQRPTIEKALEHPFLAKREAPLPAPCKERMKNVFGKSDALAGVTGVDAGHLDWFLRAASPKVRRPDGQENVDPPGETTDANLFGTRVIKATVDPLATRVIKATVDPLATSIVKDPDADLLGTTIVKQEGEPATDAALMGTTLIHDRVTAQSNPLGTTDVKSAESPEDPVPRHFRQAEFRTNKLEKNQPNPDSRHVVWEKHAGEDSPWAPTIKVNELFSLSNADEAAQPVDSQNQSSNRVQPETLQSSGDQTSPRKRMDHEARRLNGQTGTGTGTTAKRIQATRDAAQSEPASAVRNSARPSSRQGGGGKLLPRSLQISPGGNGKADSQAAGKARRAKYRDVSSLRGEFDNVSGSDESSSSSSAGNDAWPLIDKFRTPAQKPIPLSPRSVADQEIQMKRERENRLKKRSKSEPKPGEQDGALSPKNKPLSPSSSAKKVVQQVLRPREKDTKGQ